VTKSHARKDRGDAEEQMHTKARLAGAEKVFFDGDTKLVVFEDQGRQYTYTAEALYKLFSYTYTIRKGDSYSARIAASILGRSVILRHRAPDGQYVPVQQVFGDGTTAQCTW
jgi:hypothetical protein